MGASTVPASDGAAKTRYVVNLTSGTSWTVPANVLYINATLRGGGGSGSSGSLNGSQVVFGNLGSGGQVIATNLATSPGASIAYAIGAGGASVSGSNSGSSGGTTTFTGATSAVGGTGGGASSSAGNAGTATLSAGNGGQFGGYSGSGLASGAGGNGSIEIEYWV
jgi:hypothetical protein